MDILPSLPWQSRPSGVNDAPCLNEMGSQQFEPAQWHYDSLMGWDTLALACLSDWDAQYPGDALCDAMQSRGCSTTSDQSMHTWATVNQITPSTLDESSRFTVDWDCDSSSGPSSSQKISPDSFEGSNSDHLSVSGETRGYFDCTATKVAPPAPPEDRLCLGWNIPPTSTSELPQNRPFVLETTPSSHPWLTARNGQCQLDLLSPPVSQQNLVPLLSESTSTEVPQDVQRKERPEACKEATGEQNERKRNEAQVYGRAAPYRKALKRTFSSASPGSDAPRKRRRGRSTTQEIMERNRLAASNSRLQQRNREEQLTAQMFYAEDLNRELHTVFADLTKEVLELKMQVLQHANCKSTLIEGYINQAASSHVRAIQNNSRCPANNIAVRHDPCRELSTCLQ